MVRQQVLQFLLLHLLLMWDWLQNSLVVLGCPQVDKHRSIYRAVMQRGAIFIRVVCATYWTLLRPADTRRNYQV